MITDLESRLSRREMLKLTGIGTLMSVFAEECFGQACPRR